MENKKILAMMIVALMLIGGLAFSLPADQNEATSGDGGTYTYTLTYHNDQMSNTAAQELQLTVDGMTPISHAPNTTTLTALANQGSWTWDYNPTTHEGTGLGPFNSFYAAFDIDNGNAFVTKLNPYNLGQDLTGTALPNGNYNIMWVLPTVYWMVENNSVILTNDSTAGGTAYAHRIDGHTYNYIAIGVYHGSTTTIDDSTTVLTSQTGATPTTSQTRATFRTQANSYTMDTSLGTNAHSMLWNFYQWELYRLCCLTVMEGFNSQMIVGNGNVYGDNYTMATGGTNSLGPYAGNPGDLGRDNSNATLYGQEQVKLFIEDPWSTVFDYVDGIMLSNSAIYLDSSSVPTDATSLGQNIEEITATLAGSNWGSRIFTNTYLWGLTSSTSQYSSYVNGTTDYSWVGGETLYVGGESSGGNNKGINCFSSSSKLSSYPYIGSRLAFVFDVGPVDHITITSNDVSFGTVSPTNLTVSENSTITVSGNTITIDGNTITATKHTPNTAQYTYDFDHWSVSNGDTTTSGMTITAYFTRTVNSYTATIQSSNTQYGTVDVGSIPNTPYGSVIHLSGTDNNILTLNGTVVTATANDPDAYYTYGFDGYETDGQLVQDGDILIGNMTIVANFSSTNIYTVLIIPNDNTYGSLDVDQIVGVPVNSNITVNDDKLTVNGVTSTASPSPNTAQYTYGFDGFYIGSTKITAATPVLDNTTVTATFTRSVNTYAVSVSSNDTSWGTVSAASFPNEEYGSTITVSGQTISIGNDSITATIVGTDDAQYTYGFDGFYIGSTKITGTATVTGTTDITARFTQTVNKYTITWKDYNNATLDTTQVEYGTVPTHADPTRQGFQFNGWTPTPVAVTGAATYKATYLQIYTTTLKYNSNGGSGAPADQIYTGTEMTAHTFTISTTEPTTNLNYFAGWSLNKNAATPDYTGGDTINVAYNTTAVLYAVWDAPNFELSFTTKGGMTAPSMYYYSETDATHTFTIPEMDLDWYGHTFTGWATAAGGEATLEAGDTVTVDTGEKVNLYAVYELNGDGTMYGNILGIMPILFIVGLIVGIVGLYMYRRA